MILLSNVSGNGYTGNGNAGGSSPNGGVGWNNFPGGSHAGWNGNNGGPGWNGGSNGGWNGGWNGGSNGGWNGGSIGGWNGGWNNNNGNNGNGYPPWWYYYYGLGNNNNNGFNGRPGLNNPFGFGKKIKFITKAFEPNVLTVYIFLAFDHFHHLDNGSLIAVGNTNSTLSGNCIGDNVCNGAGAGVNNDNNGLDLTALKDQSLDFDNVEGDTDSKGADIDDRVQTDTEKEEVETLTKAPMTNNKEDLKPEENDNSDADDTNDNPPNQQSFGPNQNIQNHHQYPSYPSNFPSFVIGAAAVTSSIPFIRPDYFNYPPIRNPSSPDNTESTSKRPSKKGNKRPNNKTPPKEETTQGATPLNTGFSDNYSPSFYNIPNQFGQNQFGPNQFNPNHFSQNQFPPNQFQANGIGPNQFGPGNLNGIPPQFQNPNRQFGQFNSPFDTPNLDIQNFNSNNQSPNGENLQQGQPNNQQVNPQFPNGPFTNYNPFPSYFGQPSNGIIINGFPANTANTAFVSKTDNSENPSSQQPPGNTESDRKDQTSGSDTDGNNFNCIGSNVCNRPKLRKNNKRRNH